LNLDWPNSLQSLLNQRLLGSAGQARSINL